MSVPPTLTKRQVEVLNVLRTTIAEKGYAPSLNEIAATLGLRSIATVHKHLLHLAKKGFIVRQNRSRAITVVPCGPTLEDRLKVAFAAGYHARETLKDVQSAWVSFREHQWPG